MTQQGCCAQNSLGNLEQILITVVGCTAEPEMHHSRMHAHTHSAAHYVWVQLLGSVQADRCTNGLLGCVACARTGVDICALFTWQAPILLKQKTITCTM